MRVSSLVLITLIVPPSLATGCNRRSDADAAAISSAREAQIRAEAELKAIKELAARQPQPAAEPAAEVVPAAPTPVPVAQNAPAAPAAATPDPNSAACGCKAPTCTCVNVTVSVIPAARKPGNQEWDIGGGAPDPQVTLRTPLVSKKSQIFKDQLSVTTTFPHVPLSPGDGIAIDAFDSDAAANDPMGTFSTSFSGIGSNKSGAMAAARVTVTFSK